MPTAAIRAEGLGKRYVIGERRDAYGTLRDSIAKLRWLPLRSMRAGFKRRPVESVWAIKDVSFEVEPGEVVGIIGRNGAGKSTLLKVLSRITEPTEGYADIRGRVGSLLEVGTGFHPELTGRENIYLNGAILGMGKSQITRQFDEIVDFASVERFIDTPVKRYSSGMYLRLAFAVAAHMQPEILLVDEVLAVGDASFQKKCLGRMEEVANQGRTVLFVSHNMGAIRSLCNRGIVIENGTVEFSGNVNESIHRYFQAIGAVDDNDGQVTRKESSRDGFGRLQVNDGSGNTVSQAEPFEVSTTLRLNDDTTGFYLFCIMEDMHGKGVFHLQESSTDLGFQGSLRGDHPIRVEFPPLWLIPGLYSIYFKAILWGSSGSKHLSDRFPLDVEGRESSSRGSHCLMHPTVNWICDGELPMTSEPVVVGDSDER